MNKILLIAMIGTPVVVATSIGVSKTIKHLKNRIIVNGIEEKGNIIELDNSYYKVKEA